MFSHITLIESQTPVAETGSAYGQPSSPFEFKMSASKDQSVFNSSAKGRETLGPDSGNDSSTATPEMSAGSTTAAGHGQNPQDKGDDSKATMPGTRIGPQNEDLEGEQMATFAEGKVMGAQLDKKGAGWGEQDSLTSNLDRQKREQQEARKSVQDERRAGGDIDGGAGNRVENEGLNQV